MGWVSRDMLVYLLYKVCIILLPGPCSRGSPEPLLGIGLHGEYALTVHTATLVRPCHRHFIFPEWPGMCPYEYEERTSPDTSVLLALLPTTFQGPT